MLNRRDGDGNRVRQIVADGLPVITDYLNDVQPELTKLLRQSNGTTTEHFIHAPRGIHRTLKKPHPTPI